MRLSSIMSRKVITASGNASVREVCALMADNYIGSVVISEKGAVSGIITEPDIVRAIAEHTEDIAVMSASDIMISPVLTKNPELDIHETEDFMKSNRIRRLPITKDGLLVGIVTYSDILRYMKRELADKHTQVIQLKGEVDRDAVSGAYSRRYFQKVLIKAVGRIKEYGGALSILMIDIDRFKDINDTYGHDAGDAILKTITEIVENNVRDINIVCRYGGDELTVLAPISDIHGAVRMGERLCEAVREYPFVYSSAQMTVTLSIGAASWQNHMKNDRDLLIEADKALYKSKEGGRDQVNWI